jgi:hypothetical protein
VESKCRFSREEFISKLLLSYQHALKTSSFFIRCISYCKSDCNVSSAPPCHPHPSLVSSRTSKVSLSVSRSLSLSLSLSLSSLSLSLPLKPHFANGHERFNHLFCTPSHTSAHETERQGQRDTRNVCDVCSSVCGLTRLVHGTLSY